MTRATDPTAPPSRELLFLEPVEDVKERYGADTLEAAFFAATGRTFEDETEEDKDREVFA